MYNLIENSDNHSKISESLIEYYRVEPAINNNDVIIDIPDNPDSALFKHK